MIIQPDIFNWKCANVLIGDGDSYSSAGADAFMKAAKQNDIDVCAISRYEANSADMSGAIDKIMAERCCLLTVVFALSKDIVSLLVEAHKKHYRGEWFMGETIFDSLPTITNDLKNRLSDTSAVHKLLRGGYELT